MKKAVARPAVKAAPKPRPVLVEAPKPEAPPAQETEVLPTADSAASVAKPARAVAIAAGTDEDLPAAGGKTFEEFCLRSDAMIDLRIDHVTRCERPLSTAIGDKGWD